MTGHPNEGGTPDLPDAPDFAFITQADAWTMGEGLTIDGYLALVLGFNVAGQWGGIQLHPATVVDIVRACTEWLDSHADAAIRDGENPDDG
jgi:hypothetical protein